MNIIIAGGGRVGYHLARLLSEERHNITVIESDPNQVEHLDYTLDVNTMLGNAGDAMLLQSAGAGSADLFVSATGNDEINLIAAALAKGFGAKQVVARAHQATYVESDILYETVLGIDYILSPEALTAKEIVTYIENPGMVATESFGRGLIEMRHMRVSKCPLKPGQTLKDMELPPGVLLGVIGRDGKTEIPHGDSTIQEHDLVTLVGRKDSMGPIEALFQGVEVKLEKVVIMGGSTVGLGLAQTLEKRGFSVKIFDWNMARCKELAAALTKTKVVCRDAASRLALEQEHVDGADIFVAVTRDDERNIMASVLAKEVGARETLAIVHQPDFAPLVDRLGIDHAVTPRTSIANRVLKLVGLKDVSSLAVLEEGQVEIIEFKLSEESAVLGRRLSEIKFPKDSLVASILRGDNVIVPKGDDEILAGDSVILIVAAKSLEVARKLFT
jgi:trk system potassium uptake protein TrkA